MPFGQTHEVTTGQGFHMYYNMGIVRNLSVKVWLYKGIVSGVAYIDSCSTTFAEVAYW